jgi:membrane protease YdiL (CAAX protease family)
MRGQVTRRLRIGLSLYAAMTAAAVGLSRWRGAPLLAHPGGPATWAAALARDTGLSTHVISGALGLALALATIASTELLVRRARWARALRTEFRAALEGARSAELVALAVASGTAEELLFRGALQPALGLWLTSLLFGAVHFVPSRALLPWALWAALMGLLLGLVHAHTGSLVGAVVAHVVINAVNLQRITRFDPGLDAAAPHTPPSLVPRRRTRSGR